MGTVLDSPQDIRHRKTSTSRQAYCSQEDLETYKDQSVIMMALTERTYTIPLRREWLKTPKYKRAKKAVNAVREFAVKHMKSDNVLIGPKLNLKIWEHGMKNPPHSVKVTCVKDDKEDTVRVELFGFKFEKKEAKEKKAKPKGIAGKLQEKLGPKEDEAPKEAVTTKKDIKELKKGVEVKKPEPEAPKEEKKEEAAATEEPKVEAEKKEEVKEEKAPEEKKE
jgi:large subunit ribosomal protein L31e